MVNTSVDDFLIHRKVLLLYYIYWMLLLMRSLKFDESLGIYQIVIYINTTWYISLYICMWACIQDILLYLNNHCRRHCDIVPSWRRRLAAMRWLWRASSWITLWYEPTMLSILVLLKALKSPWWSLVPFFIRYYI